MGILAGLGALAETVAPGLVLGAGQAALGGVGNRKQYHRSKKLAAFQNQLNKDYLDYYNMYNSPTQQMERYKAAGLNPHLAISGGNPGNMAAPQKAADYPNLPDFSYLSGIMPLINQTAMTQSQVQATNAKTEQTYAVTALKRLEREVMARNPLLDDSGFTAIIEGLKATAALKQEDINARKLGNFWYERTQPLVTAKLEQEINLLEQRFRLGELDGDIKRQVLSGKEFQNAILEVQKKFLADGEIGSQQILQFVQLLLMKIL